MRIFLSLLLATCYSASAEVSVKVPSLTNMANSEIVPGNDLFMIWDASAGKLKKITGTQLDARWTGGGGGGGISDVTASLPLLSSGGSSPNLTCRTATGSVSGCLSASDFATFAAKQSAISFGNLTSNTTGLSVSGGAGAVAGAGVSLSIQTASDAQPGLLSASDHASFAAKQAAGDYIDELTGDVTAVGPGAAAATIANNAVSDAKFRTSAAVSLVGRSANSSGNVADIAAASNNTVLKRASNALAFATIVNADVDAAAAIDRSKLGTGSNSHVVINSAGGAFSSEATLAKSRGGTGADMSSVTFPSSGTIITTAASGLVESYTGHIETAAAKTYVIDEYASFAKQITNIRVKCASGTITAALQIGGSNITTCNGISVTSTAGTTTCDTGSSNDLAANGRLTLVTTSNSACLDLTFTIKTARD